MASDSNGQVCFVKDTNIIVKFLQKIHFGRICFHKLYVSYCLCLALFGYTESLIFTGNELVEDRGSSMYMHILSGAQMKSIFTLDGK